MKAIGIDIGGTKIAAGLVDSNGRLLNSTFLEITNISTPDAFMEALEPVVGAYLDAGGVAGIGIGSAGPLDREKGELQNHYTLNPGLLGMRIVELFQRTFGLPVILDHDVNAALWAHCCFGGVNGRDSLMLTFGTGIGGAVYKAGRFLRGAGGCAPELGHILIHDRESRCYCGTPGCLESVASGSQFTVEAQERFGSIPGFYAAYGNKADEAVQMARRFTKDIERGLITLIRVFEPELIILGGGMMEGFYPVFRENLSEDFPEKAFVAAGFEIQPSLFDNRAGMIGAAGFILKGVEGEGCN